MLKMIYKFLGLFLWFASIYSNPEIYLEGRLTPENGRHKTFSEALRLMTERNVQI